MGGKDYAMDIQPFVMDLYRGDDNIKALDTCLCMTAYSIELQ